MNSTLPMILGSTMLYRSLFREVSSLLPPAFTDCIYWYIRSLTGRVYSPKFTMVFPENEGLVYNEVYEAADAYLGGKTCPTTKRSRLIKPKMETSWKISLDKGEEFYDVFDGAVFKWRLICKQSEQNGGSYTDEDGRIQVIPKTEVRSFEVTFEEKHRKLLEDSYLPYVLEEAKSITEARKTVKLFTVRYGGGWTSMKLDHPSTFNTLALDPELKKTIMNDLDGFLKRKKFYKETGRAWKRGYLLYGPPGTGKSSLIAAMANYLNFDIFDMDLNQISNDNILRGLMMSMPNKSMLVFEDIDCGIDVQDRTSKPSPSPSPYTYKQPRVSLSAVLNSIDGIWSSCGEGRIIIFTTNHKDKLDPALIRPGRMDVHINLSYCTPSAFKILAFNYLKVKHHPVLDRIENLISKVEVTPAEVAEKLTTNDKPDVVIEELVDFLEKKKIQQDEAKTVKGNEGKETKGNQEEKETSNKEEDLNDEDDE